MRPWGPSAHVSRIWLIVFLRAGRPGRTEASGGQGTPSGRLRPPGKSPRQARHPKTLSLIEIRIYRIRGDIPARSKGRIAIVTTRGPDRGGRGQRRRDRCRRAGHSVSGSTAPNDSAARVRQNRVVLAPEAGAKSCGDAACSNRNSASVNREATGATELVSPGRARHKPSTHCAGKVFGENP